MSSNMEFLRAISESNGNIDELKLKFDDDTSEFESDEEFMQECMAMCLPTMVQMMVMDEAAEAMDEATREAFIKVNDYFVGQGLIDEAASVNINNPKVTFIKMGRDAQIKRLTTILTLKMSRRENNGEGSKAYKKYKLGQKIKKENMAQMKAKYGTKAEKLAKKLYQKMLKSKKANAVVTDAKTKAKK